MGFGNNFEKLEKVNKDDITRGRKENYVIENTKVVNLKNIAEQKISPFPKPERENYKLNKLAELLAQTNFQKLSQEAQESYIFCLFYIDQLAQNKTRAEVTPDEKQFFLDFQTMNQSLGIDYQLPPFKESRETQSINTMADVYHHTDTLVQDKNAGFQDYIQNSPSTKIKESIAYKKDKLNPQDFCKLYPKRSERQQDRQRTNPEWFDPYTKQLDLNKVDPDSRPNIEERYKQAMTYGQDFLTNLDKEVQVNTKNYVMSFVLKEFSSLFMLSSSYDAYHLGYDFALGKIVI